MFINSGNDKTSDPHKLLLNLSDKTAFLLLAKDMFSENKNLTSNSWRWTNLNYVRQMKRNKFITFMLQLIISTSNATFELPSKQKRNHDEYRCECKKLNDWGSCKENLPLVQVIVSVIRHVKLNKNEYVQLY